MIHLDLKKLLFIDIETAGIVEKFGDLTPRFQELWITKMKKSGIITDNNNTYGNLEQSWLNNASLHPEFAQVVCFAVGGFNTDNTFHFSVHINNGGNGEEAALLKQLTELLKHKERIIGHNIKGFDVPFLIKRYLINDLPIPVKINIAGKKPWEVDMVDTLEMWKLGAYSGQSASLDLLAACFDLPSPKADMDGSMVHHYYYLAEPVLRVEARKNIGKYCVNDIKTLANVAQKMFRQPIAILELE